MNFRKIVVYDFETDGVDPHLCEPVQIAAVVLDARKLEVIPGSEFNSMMRPTGITGKKYLEDEKRLGTIKWHAGIRDCTTEEIIEDWKKAPAQKLVWEKFSNHVNKFNPNNKMFTAPMSAGMNIREFDNVIVERLNEKHGIKTMFWKRDKVDILDFCFSWFENLEDAPKNYKMDTLREYLGMSGENAHDALQDVKDSAEIIKKFINLHRSVSKKVKFKGAFGKLDD